MKYDDKYPNAEPGTQWGRESILKSSKSKPCRRCSQPTTWLDIDFQTPICSEECLKDAWEAFKEVYDRTRRRMERKVISDE